MNKARLEKADSFDQIRAAALDMMKDEYDKALGSIGYSVDLIIGNNRGALYARETGCHIKQVIDLLYKDIEAIRQAEAERVTAYFAAMGYTTKGEVK